jgi:ArsR family transcriptional regulator
MPADTLDRMFRACADRTRLRILNLLVAGEICVGDLVSVIDAPQSTVSRHLAYLRRAGLVVAQRQATWCFYALAEPDSEFHQRLLACLSCCQAEVPQLRRDVHKLGRLRRAGGCCPRTPERAVTK